MTLWTLSSEIHKRAKRIEIPRRLSLPYAALLPDPR